MPASAIPRKDLCVIALTKFHTAVDKLIHFKRPATPVVLDKPLYVDYTVELPKVAAWAKDNELTAVNALLKAFDENKHHWVELLAIAATNPEYAAEVSGSRTYNFSIPTDTWVKGRPLLEYLYRHGATENTLLALIRAGISHRHYPSSKIFEHLPYRIQAMNAGVLSSDARELLDKGRHAYLIRLLDQGWIPTPGDAELAILSPESSFAVELVKRFPHLKMQKVGGQLLVGTAVANGKNQVLQAFLDAGLDPVEVTYHDRTLLDVAIITYNHQAIDLLLKQGVPLNINSLGNTLELAVVQLDPFGVNAILDHARRDEGMAKVIKDNHLLGNALFKAQHNVTRARQPRDLRNTRQIVKLLEQYAAETKGGTP